MDKERQIWVMAQQILDDHGDFVDDLSIHESEDFGIQRMKIYCSDGYCFELTCEEIHEDDVPRIGYQYTFCEPWGEFKEAGIDRAIELLAKYTMIPVNKLA